MIKKNTKLLSKNKKLEIEIPLKEYTKVFINIKNRVQEAQVSAAVAANKELMILYWTVGKIMHEQQGMLQ